MKLAKKFLLWVSACALLVLCLFGLSNPVMLFLPLGWVLLALPGVQLRTQGRLGLPGTLVCAGILGFLGVRFWNLLPLFSFSQGLAVTYPGPVAALLVMTVLAAAYACCLGVKFLLRLSEDSVCLRWQIKTPGLPAKRWQQALLCIAIAMVFYLFTSMHSPLMQRPYWDDPAIFASVARFWHHGKLPYVQAFDHKGPLIFGIYLLGELLSPVWGIFLLESLALGAALYYAGRIGTRLSCPGGICPLLVLAYACITDLGYGITEDWILPLLMLCTDALLCFAAEPDNDRQPVARFAFFFGLTIAAALLTRVTNGVMVMVYTLCVAVYLAFQREFLRLLRAAGGFLAGFGVLVLPFVVYFAANHALEDFWWGTVGYNLSYSGGSGLDLGMLLRGIGILLPAWLLLGDCLIHWRENRLLCTTLVLAVLATAWATLSLGVLFLHYYILAIPFLPVAFARMHRRLPRQCTALIALVLYAFLGGTWLIGGALKAANLHPGDSDFAAVAQRQAARIPQEDRDSVIGYNLSATWYLVTDIDPCFKYFILQDFQSARSEQMTQENLEFYQSLAAKYIVVESPIRNPEIAAIVAEHYTCMDTSAFENTAGISRATGTLTLYCRNDA